MRRLPAAADTTLLLSLAAVDNVLSDAIAYEAPAASVTEETKI